MPVVSRVTDMAFNPADSHGRKCCSHSVIGPAVSGSPDTFVNGLAVLRIGDPGVHAACCGPNTWACMTGSATVTVNDIPVCRLGDLTAHCGGIGTLVQGSPDLDVGG